MMRSTTHFSLVSLVALALTAALVNGQGLPDAPLQMAGVHPRDAEIEEVFKLETEDFQSETEEEQLIRQGFLDPADIVAVEAAAGPPVDVVFVIAETKETVPAHRELIKQTPQIFEKLNKMTNGNFRVGVVGFGADKTTDRDSFILGALSDREEDFKSAIMDADQNPEPSFAHGFYTTSLVAYDNVGDGVAGPHLDGSANGQSFPSARGFCAMLVTNHPSTGEPVSTTALGAGADEIMFESTRDALSSVGHSQLYGFIPQVELNRREGNTYARLSTLTDGKVADMAGFVKGGRKATKMLERQLKQCVRNMKLVE